MKKAYSTPDILFDSFSLSENIANTTCTRNITGQYSGSCGLQFGNRIVFTTSAVGCKFKIEDGSSMLDGLCYHIPTDDNKLFNS